MRSIVDGFFAGPNDEIDWFKSNEKDTAYSIRRF